jgi:catechol 2,3-dioxygenase-like lactoylglutathione lyase family enzyme
MPIRRLDHYSIRTSRLEETRRFYCDVIGLADGDRPQFDFPGAWLYSGERAVVHVVGIDPNDKSGLVAYLGEKAGEDVPGTGTIDHVAFVAQGVEEMHERLKARGIAYRDRAIPAMGLHQIFVEDPNGVTIELNYVLADEEPAAAAFGSAAAEPANA